MKNICKGVASVTYFCLASDWLMYLLFKQKAVGEKTNHFYFDSSV